MYTVPSPKVGGPFESYFSFYYRIWRILAWTVSTVLIGVNVYFIVVQVVSQ